MSTSILHKSCACYFIKVCFAYFILLDFLLLFSVEKLFPSLSFKPGEGCCDDFETITLIACLFNFI